MLLHLRPLLEDAWHGRIYRDHFYEPYASWYPELPRNLYVGVLWMAAFAAVAMLVGFRARAATITVWAVVTYDLFLSTTNFHNNRAYLVLVLAALAVTPCDRELSLDAWLARRRGPPGAADRRHRAGRCGCCGSRRRRSTARQGSASCSTRTGSAAR